MSNIHMRAAAAPLFSPGVSSLAWWEIVTCLNHGVIPYRCFLNPEIAFF